MGFIGLGHLGSPIARRLLNAGFPLVVYNRDANKTKALSTLGAEVARDPGELAAEVDAVLSCVADGAAVEAIYLGEGGVLRNVRARHSNFSEMEYGGSGHLSQALPDCP